MKLTQEQYEKIAKYLPKQRGNLRITNLQFLNAIYVHMNSWSKGGVLDKVFSALQDEGVININVVVVCLDSTTVKVYPDACGA